MGHGTWGWSGSGILWKAFDSIPQIWGPGVLTVVDTLAGVARDAFIVHTEICTLLCVSRHRFRGRLHALGSRRMQSACTEYLVPSRFI